MCRRRWRRTISCARSLRTSSDDVEEARSSVRPEAGACRAGKGRDADRLYQRQGANRRTITKTLLCAGLLGMTKDDAEKALTEKGLSIGSVNEVAESTAEAGSVVWRSQDAGAEVARHCRQTIQISKGKSTSNNNSPDITAAAIPAVGTTAMATTMIRRASAVRPFRFRCRTSTDTAHKCHLCGRRNQYDDTCNTSGGNTSISVSGSGGRPRDVTVSVDGSTTSQTYTFS